MHNWFHTNINIYMYIYKKYLMSLSLFFVFQLMDLRMNLK